MFSTTTPSAIQPAQTAHAAGTFTKRIGYTTYHVGVYFSGTSTETVQDKILRLVKNEAATGKEVGP